MNPFLATDPLTVQAVESLNRIAVERRAKILLDALTFQAQSIEEEFASVGPVRAAFATYWETVTGTPIPIPLMREVMGRESALLHESVPTHSDIDAPMLAKLFALVVRVVRPQVEAWQSYVQQMRRLTCPGCGDDGCMF